MVDIDRLAGAANERFLKEFVHGNGFYGRAENLSIGTGVFANPIRYPMFDLGTGKFTTVEGLAYVLTHECDIDENNDRHFNDLFVICPVIPLEHLIVEFEREVSEDYVTSIIHAIASNTVTRVFYLPPHEADGLKLGGVLYLNQLSSAHTGSFDFSKPEKLCALSIYGQRALDQKLQQHFLRPKAEELPRTTPIS